MPITVGSVSLSVINLLDQSITMGILQTFWGLTESEAGGLYGVYSYAGNLFALPAAFIYPLTISLIPAIGAALARGDRASAGRHTAAAFRLTALLALPAGVGLSVLEMCIRDRYEWVRRLLENQEGTDAEEFIHSLKVDMFADEVFVFTPRGDVINLPAGATPIDLSLIHI